MLGQIMKRTTLAQVNKALKTDGIDCQLVKGQGYFYFEGPAVDTAFEQGVYGVFRLSDFSVDQWVEEAKERINK